MATSLAAQLAKLRVPQTTILSDSKKRVSILFDPKEAATKDRNTIFHLGHNGLMELISINPIFIQFEQTLFDKTTINMERSVESAEVNELLDKNLKKFFYHLSPYFMLKPAHMCLEWLIRRFHIHLYNKSDFIGLILPYHETNIFVKCIQTLSFQNENNEWKWLEAIKKPGVPLSKTAILNRAANYTGFLKFVCEQTVAAIKELDTKGYTLQAQISFYYTTVIGALENVNPVTEIFITKILNSILKGLSSNVLDFTASVFMILSHLMSKAQLNLKLLDSLIGRIIKKKHLKVFPDEELLTLISYKWFTTTLGALSAQEISVNPICIPIVGSCLRRVQLKQDGWDVCKTFLDELLLTVHFDENDSTEIIKCTLDNYHRKDQHKKTFPEDEVIEITSDDEDIMLDEDIQKWYAAFLQKLEKQYPTAFDYTIKEALQGKENISKSRHLALKAVLAFRLKSAYSEENASIYENLYHNDVNNRIAAVKFLVKNFSKLNVSTESKNLLKDSLNDRLIDENPKVVYETLQLSTKNLIDLIKHQQLLNCLVEILRRNYSNHRHHYIGDWSKVIPKVLKHLTNKDFLEEVDSNKIFINLIPFLVPSENEISYVKEILTNDFVEYFNFLKEYQNYMNSNHNQRISSNEFLLKFINCLENPKTLMSLPNPEDVLSSFRQSCEEENDLKLSNLSYFVIHIMSCYKQKQKHSQNPKLGLEILNVVSSQLRVKTNPLEYDENENNWIKIAKRNKFSLDLYLKFLETLVEYSNFSNDIKEFHSNSISLQLILRIIEILLENSFTNSKKIPTSITDRYAESLKSVLDKLWLTNDKLQFFSNFFIVHLIPDLNISIEYQLCGIRLYNLMLKSTKNTNFVIDRVQVIKIFTALCHTNSFIRKCSMNTLEILSETKNESIDKRFQILMNKLLTRKEEILIDCDQLPLILFIMISPQRNTKSESLEEKESARFCLEQILEVLCSTNSAGDKDVPLGNYMKVEILKLIVLINNSQIFKKVIKIGLDLLENIETRSKASPMVTDDSNINEFTCLNEESSKIFKLISSRFDEDNTKIVTEMDNAWSFIEKTFKLHKVLTFNSDGKIVSIVSELMGTFTEAKAYDKISDKLKEPFLTLIINAVTLNQDPSVPSSANKLMKDINLDCKHILKILQNMKNTENFIAPESSSSTLAQNKRVSVPAVCAPDTDIINSEKWKNGITLLEFLQNKKNLQNYEQLIPILFDILKLCLDFEEQSHLEYTKQLILTCLLLLCQKYAAETKNKKAKSSLLPETAFKVHLIGQCIRITQNPQTNHHALILLAQCASMVPQQVLNNIMDLFTFMGSSVVRHDDAFSFQIITNIIESIIPTLVKASEDKKLNTNRDSDDEENDYEDKNVIPILKIFVSIILDVPEHRRLLLYTKLIKILGADKYLWMFLATLFESHVILDGKVMNEQSATEQLTRIYRVSSMPSHLDDLPKRIGIALQITKDFEPTIILQTCINLLYYLKKLPKAKIENKNSGERKMEIDITDDSEIFSIDGHSARQLRHYKYIILQYISTLTSSTEFINQIAVLDETEILSMKPYYQNFIIRILSYIPDLTECLEENEYTSHLNYWKVILHHCYDILDNAVSLLSPDMLLVVVKGLMQHKILTVRRKIIEILIDKLQYKKDFFNTCNEENLQNLLEPLNLIIDSIHKEKKIDNLISAKSVSSKDIVKIQQLSLNCIKLLSKLIGLKCRNEFKSILIKLTKVIKNHEKISKLLLATIILTINEIAANLKFHSISELTKFLPYIIEILQQQYELLKPNYSNSLPIDHLLIAIITGMQKLFEILPLFLGPYLIDIITLLVKIWVKLIPYEEIDKPKTTMLINKLNFIWSKISTVIPLRVLMPNYEKIYKNLILDVDSLEGVKFLANLLVETFKFTSNADIQSLMTEIELFYLNEALNFRALKITRKLNITTVNDIENHIINSFVILVLKLSEGQFRPLHYKLYNWAIKKDYQTLPASDKVKEKIITYFSLTSKLAEQLKSLFIFFASDFIQDAANLLNLCNSSKIKDDGEFFFKSDYDDEDEDEDAEENKNSILIKFILETLNLIFIHNTKGFLNAHRFDILMPAIVDQLENILIVKSDTLKKLLISTVAELSLACNSDQLLKQLNYQVLLKTRNNNPEIRINSFLCCIEITRKLGEEFNSLLPETVPFIAELFEDENDSVEKQCKKGVQEMEKILGESLQKYF